MSAAAAVGVAIRAAEAPAKALVLGYANLAEPAIHRGIGLLAGALDAFSSPVGPRRGADGLAR